MHGYWSPLVTLLVHSMSWNLLLFHKKKIDIYNLPVFQYPRIDTQQLDQQIKSIMTEVIPVIKEHMDNMCSPQLLAYIKRLVLSLTRQYDSGEEFARFFHRQLGSILQDTLAKYEGRK